MLKRFFSSSAYQNAIPQAINISRPSIDTVKAATSKKSILHAEYVDFYRSNNTVLILQHNNLTQAELLKLRGELKSVGAKLRIMRVGILEHAIKVAAYLDSPAGASKENQDVNSRATQIVAKELYKSEQGKIKLLELLCGPICTITYPGQATLQPSAIKKTISLINESSGRLLLLGGKLEEQTFAVAQIDVISKLPNLETLQGQLLSLLSTPASRLTGLLGSRGQELGRVLEGRKLAMEEESK